MTSLLGTIRSQTWRADVWLRGHDGVRLSGGFFAGGAAAAVPQASRPARVPPAPSPRTRVTAADTRAAQNKFHQNQHAP